MKGTQAVVHLFTTLPTLWVLKLRSLCSSAARTSTFVISMDAPHCTEHQIKSPKPGAVEMVGLLLSWGADETATTHYGDTPADRTDAFGEVLLIIRPAKSKNLGAWSAYSSCWRTLWSPGRCGIVGACSWRRELDRKWSHYVAEYEPMGIG